MSLLTDPTLELLDPSEAPTDELPVAVLPIARPVPRHRPGQVRRRPRTSRRGRRRVINLAMGGGISAAAAALAMAWPTAGPVILTLATGLLP